MLDSSLILKLLKDKLIAKGRSDTTIKIYLFFVKKFLSFVNHPPPYSENDLVSFFAKLKEEGASERGRAYEQNSLRMVYRVMKRFFELMGWTWPFSKEDMPKLVEKPQPYVTFEDWKKMLNLARKNPVHTAMLWILWVTGCRREQLCRLLKKDFDPKSGKLTVPAMKGGQPVEWILPKPAVDAILQVISFKPHSPYLIPGKKGMIHPSTVTRVVDHYLKKAGIKARGAHSLRRGRATFLFKELGMRERELQAVMGWKTPTMPHKYIQLISEEERKRIYEKDPIYRL